MELLRKFVKHGGVPVLSMEDFETLMYGPCEDASNLKQDVRTTRHDNHHKPLAKVSFYLDLKGYLSLNNLTNDIKCLGGTVETFLSKDVKYVVTNRPNWKQQLRDGALDNGSLPSTPNSLSTTKSGIANISPYNVESPVEVEGNRVKTVTSRASAMLEKARKSTTKGSSDVLQIARMWGVKVISLTAICNLIKRSKPQHKFKPPNVVKDLCKGKMRVRTSGESRNLRQPFLLFEDANREYKPHYKEFHEWPVINLMTDHKRSPFAKLTSMKLNEKGDAVHDKHDESSFPFYGKRCSSDSMRPVQNVAGTTAQPSRDSVCKASKKIKAELKSGYCEMCLCRYRDAYSHVNEKSHQKHLAEPGLFAMLDKKIAALPDIYTFAKMVVQHSSSNATSHSKPSDLSLSNDNQNSKENFTMPTANPAFQKRKRLETCHSSMKKLRARAATAPLSEINGGNVRSCRPVFGDSDEFPTMKQLCFNSEKVRNPSPVTELNLENITQTTDGFVERQDCDSNSSVPLVRKSLEPLGMNIIEPSNFRSSESKKPQVRSMETQTYVSHRDNTTEKTKSVRLLRSTALRRISACQPSTRGASSPSLPNSVLGDSLDPRKVNSSPSDSAFSNKRRSFFGVRRALDLGEPSLTPRTLPSLDAGQKQRSCLEGIHDRASSNMPSLKTVLDAPLPEVLSDMPLLECVLSATPSKAKPPQCLLSDVRCNADSTVVAACDDSLAPGKTALPKKPENCDSLASLQSFCTADIADKTEDMPRLDDASKVDNKNDCSVVLGLDEESVRVASASLHVHEAPTCAIEEVGMLGGTAPLDLSCKMDKSESSGDSPGSTMLSSPKASESECFASGGGTTLPLNSASVSQSSIFNLVSSPEPTLHSTTGNMTDASLIPRSDGSIPKVVFRRVQGGKRIQWTVRVLSDEPCIA